MDLNLSRYTGEDILREIRAGPGSAQGPRSLPIHQQADGSRSVHGDRRDNQGLACRLRRRRVSIACGLTVREWHCACTVASRKVIVAHGKRNRQAPARWGRALAAPA
jgi:hypothetical protein